MSNLRKYFYKHLSELSEAQIAAIQREYLYGQKTICTLSGKYQARPYVIQQALKLIAVRRSVS